MSVERETQKGSTLESHFELEVHSSEGQSEGPLSPLDCSKKSQNVKNDRMDLLIPEGLEHLTIPAIARKYGENSAVRRNI